MARVERSKVLDRDSRAAVWSTKVIASSNSTGQLHEVVAVAKNVWRGNSLGDNALLKFDQDGKQVAEYRQTFKEQYASLVAENHGTTLLAHAFFTKPAALVFIRPGQEDVVKRVSLELVGNPDSHGCLALHANPPGEDVPAFLVWGAKQRCSTGNHVQQWWSASGVLLREEVYEKVEINRMPAPNYLPHTGTVVFWPHWRKTRIIELHVYDARTSLLAGNVLLSHPIADHPHAAVEFSNREIGFFYHGGEGPDAVKGCLLVNPRLETLSWPIDKSGEPLAQRLVSATRQSYRFQEGKVSWSLHRFPHNIQPILSDGADPNRRALVFGDREVCVVDFDHAQVGTLSVELFKEDKMPFRYRTTPPSAYSDGAVFYVIRNDTELYRCKLVLLNANLRDAGAEATADSVLCGLKMSLPGDLYDRVADALLHRLKVARKNKQHTSA
jgi:hypothetical protein